MWRRRLPRLAQARTGQVGAAPANLQTSHTGAEREHRHGSGLHHAADRSINCNLRRQKGMENTRRDQVAEWKSLHELTLNFTGRESESEHFYRCWQHSLCRTCLAETECSWCPFVSFF